MEALSDMLLHLSNVIWSTVLLMSGVSFKCILAISVWGTTQAREAAAALVQLQVTGCGKHFSRQIWVQVAFTFLSGGKLIIHASSHDSCMYEKRRECYEQFNASFFSPPRIAWCMWSLSLSRSLFAWLQQAQLIQKTGRDALSDDSIIRKRAYALQQSSWTLKIGWTFIEMKISTSREADDISAGDCFHLRYQLRKRVRSKAAGPQFLEHHHLAWIHRGRKILCSGMFHLYNWIAR